MMKKVAVFFADGFEEVESLTVVDYLRRAEVTVDTVSTTNKKSCLGAHGVEIVMDKLMKDIKLEYDGYIIPGGSDNAFSMKNNKELLDILSKEFNNGKLVSAICASPTVLYEAGITSGKKITSYPGVFKNGESGFEYLDEIVVRDNNLITSRGPSTAVYWSLSIIEYLTSKEKREAIESQILLNLI